MKTMWRTSEAMVRAKRISEGLWEILEHVFERVNLIYSVIKGPRKENVLGN